MTLPQLFGQVRRHGYTVAFSDGQPSLRPTRPDAKLPDALMDTLKRRRPEIVSWFQQPTTDPEPEEPPADPTRAPARPEWETCKVCKATVHESMTPDDARILCNQIGAKGNVARHGFLGIPATDPCPYHPPTSSGRGGR